MKPAVAVLYSDASGAALIHALKDWRSSYAPSAAYEQLLAEFVKGVTVTTNIRPEGRCSIIVGIDGRRVQNNEVYYFEATLVAGELRLESIT